MPIVFAFCRSAPSVRFIAFATCATGVLAFEWALSSRKSSLVHGLRTAAFFFGICCSSLPAGRRDSATYIRFAPVPLRAEEKSARARTRKLMESTLSALEPTGAVPYGVRLSTCHGIAPSVQARVRDRAAGRAPQAPRRCAARASARIVTWRKSCEARKPAQRLHSRPEP